MATITAVEKQKRGRRANVYVDGEYAFSLRLDVLQLAGLTAGGELTEERRRELETEDQRLGAVEAALRLLALGPRSVHDLRERLSRRRGFRREAVDHAMRRMKELGYLNDAAFARFWVESRQAATPRSKRALAFELGRKGVAREQLDEALDGVSDAEAAYDAAQRRMRVLRGVDHQTFERRLGAFLNSRGFGYGVARSTIQRCWAEMNGGEV
ncbi:MAG TPA: regulatory protein RecX [Dehalococcoidia bacterium]